jgi:hypothetical protein
MGGGLYGIYCGLCDVGVYVCCVLWDGCWTLAPNIIREQVQIQNTHTTYCYYILQTAYYILHNT